MNRRRLLLVVGLLVLAVLACSPNSVLDPGYVDPDDALATSVAQAHTAAAIEGTTTAQTEAAQIDTQSAAATETAAAAEFASVEAELATPTDEPSATPTPSPTETETPPVVVNAYTDEDIAALLLPEADAGGLTLQSTTDYGPEAPLGLKERFGSAEEAQPFIDAGLLRIGMVAYDTGGTACTNVCYLISTVMIFSDGTGASQASSFWLTYQQGRDETLQPLTAAQLEEMFSTANITSSLTISGTTGNIGVGVFQSPTFTLWAPHSNAFLILEAGGKKDAFDMQDVLKSWHAMELLALAGH